MLLVISWFTSSTNVAELITGFPLGLFVGFNYSIWLCLHFNCIWIYLNYETNEIYVCSFFFNLDYYVWIFRCFFCNKFFEFILQWYFIIFKFLNLSRFWLWFFKCESSSAFDSTSFWHSSFSFFKSLICSNNFWLKFFKCKYSSSLSDTLSLSFFLKLYFPYFSFCFLTLDFLVYASNFSLWSLSWEISSFFPTIILSTYFFIFGTDFWLSWRNTFEIYCMSSSVTESNFCVTSWSVIFFFM